MKTIFILLIGIIMGIGAYSYIGHSGNIVSSISSLLGAAAQTFSSPVSNCTSQVNGQVAQLQAQNPAGTDVVIVNTTQFTYYDYNSTLQAILQWGMQWNKNYVAINGKNPPIFITYANLAAMGNNATHKAGIGEAVRVTPPAQDARPGILPSEYFYTYLCDYRGVLYSSANVKIV
jgi:hypothetical protein